MATFKELKAQIDAHRNPSTSSGNTFAGLQQQVLADRPNAPVAPVVETPPVDLSIMDRFGMSTARRASSVAETMANATGLSADTAVMAAGGNLEDGRSDMAREAAYLTPAEASLVNPSLTDTAVQIGGDVAGLVWDWGADALVEMGQEGFQLLPVSMQEGAKEQFGEFVNGPIGSQGVAAMKAGVDAWNAFSARFPQEARTLAKGFDFVPAGKHGQYVMGGKNGRKLIRTPLTIPTELTPLRMEKVGMRQVLRPPTGQDKDIYNMIVPEQTKQQRLLQVQEGRITQSPLSRKQSLVPSTREWEIVDELKTVEGISANKTMVQNSQLVSNKVSGLNDQAIKLTSDSKGGVDPSTLSTLLRQEIDAVIPTKPMLFGADGTKSSSTIDNMLAQLDIILADNGTTWGGLLKSRQDFDNVLLNDLKLGTFGTGRKAGAAQEVHTVIRNAINTMVIDNVPKTKELLKRQNLLLDGGKHLNLKAAEEAANALGRLLRDINVHQPTTPLAQLSTLLSPLVWAGAVAVSPFVLIKKSIDGVLQLPSVAAGRGTIKPALRQVIQESQKVLKMVKDKKLREQMQIDIKVMATLLHTFSDNKTETVENEQPPMLSAGNY